MRFSRKDRRPLAWCVPARGFTLIELMITLLVVALLIGVGVPSLTQFIAAQRVRTVASDLLSDVALARAEAIKESRRAILQRTAGATNSWKDGWQVCVDLNSNNACDANEVRKTSSPIGGRVRSCSQTANFASQVIFRPDGRVMVAAVGATDGITISDDLGDGDAGNDLIRTVVFGLSGRPVLLHQDGGTNGGAPCP